jgi:hypothetical protein
MNKIGCKNGKDPSKEVSKIKIFNYNKNTFSSFCQKKLQAMDETFLPIFKKSLGPYGVRDGLLCPKK